MRFSDRWLFWLGVLVVAALVGSAVTPAVAGPVTDRGGGGGGP